MIGYGKGEKIMTPKKIAYIVLGSICFGLGTVGVFLPVLPTTPFYLATVFFWTRSSERLNEWFKGTKFYEKYIADYVKGRGMTLYTKLKITGTITLFMGVSSYFMLSKGVVWPCVFMGIVWLIHFIYLFFRVPLLREERGK